MQYSKDSLNAFRSSTSSERGSPPAKIRKGSGAAPLKTAKEPGEKQSVRTMFCEIVNSFLPPKLNTN
ncbi:MAG: hypothetical protein COY22_00915 [Candidatus Tagabacteria bacterium CG_4_10_14_0_2_um_filter_40_13]|uniref:Uncharacterized protein n=1 Tax=Candidatus Tagabacteria bacterium CG03_land_8_20_14_0_80_41_22 TaxID=1975020 RepID=A0A2M7B9J0_9BACT|nr:MAG: hypothetical protein COS58_00700 [Candidatus Tagabacteria bacterium CG03_land_8_20_14_0_80_41_22]PIZ56502.1 MAG: hypothetical protein COY22_00915 [Candidatus Tagabacteria bacterium CG_4_10_14_0_2_um_filter_40_13]